MPRSTEDTRARILAATWEDLLSGEGVGARMSDIAKRAGVSRQALYLHFSDRTDLLVATARWVDEVEDVDARLAASRAARSGRDRLRLFIEAWGGYIPVIAPIARVLLAARGSDAAAAEAWADRMAAVRHGCAAAIAALADDGDLAPDLKRGEATDLLWALLSFETWEQLRFASGFSQKRYLASVRRMAERVLLTVRAG